MTSWESKTWPRKAEAMTRRGGVLMGCLVLLMGMLGSVGAWDRGVRGRVVDEAGEVVSAVVVRGYAWDATPDFPSIGEVTTGADGRFEFSGLKEEFNYLGVRDSRYALLLKTVTIEEGETKDLELVMRAGKEVQLKVVDPQGKALSRAKLEMIQVNDPVNGNCYARGAAFARLGWPEVISDETGMMTLGVLPEDVQLSLWVGDEMSVRGELKDVTIAEARERGVRLREGSRVEFRLHSSAEMLRSLENEELTLRFYSDDFSLVDQPESVHRNAVSFRAIPGKYRFLQLTGDGVAVTPMYGQRQTVAVEVGKELALDFLVRPTVTLKGRVVEEGTGKPIVGADLEWGCENFGGDGKLAFEDSKDAWAHLGWGVTDEKGEYEIHVPRGKCQVTLSSEEYLTREDEFEFEVGDETVQIPELRAVKPPVISGVVLDGEGKPVSDCVVRLGNIFYIVPTKTDSEGRFELTMKTWPWNFQTGERHEELRVVAFDPHRPLEGVMEIAIEDVFDAKDLKVVLTEADPAKIFAHYLEGLTPWLKGEPTEEQKESIIPEGQVGQKPPALDAMEWLNLKGESASLETFRGKYVFLDFSTTWCGPCRADLPSIKLVHELYGEDVVVIYVHDNSVGVKEIKEYVEKEGVIWPVAIDHPDGRVLKAFRGIGVEGYPSYVLLDREGKIVANDSAIPGPGLRGFKLEIVRGLLLGEKPGAGQGG